MIALPVGASPVDFAYAIHSDVGNTCVGAKINGRVSPLRTVLHNGDQVEILRSSGQTPDPSWETFVVTGKARASIRRYVRHGAEAEYVTLGKSILDSVAQRHGITLVETAFEPAELKHGMRSPQDIYAAVGRGDLEAEGVLALAYPETVKPKRPRRAAEPRKLFRRRKGGRAIPIRGLTPGMAVHLADCCHPLPGDRIVGLVTEGKGVTIHTIDCEILESFTSTPERWLDVAWDLASDQPEMFTGRIMTVLNNEPGSLNVLTEVIARSNGNISNLRITNRSIEFFELTVDIEVRDVRHLTNIVAALRANPTVFKVERAQY